MFADICQAPPVPDEFRELSSAQSAVAEIERILDCCEDFPGEVLRLLFADLQLRDDLTRSDKRGCHAAALVLNREDWRPHRERQAS